MLIRSDDGISFTNFSYAFEQLRVFSWWQIDFAVNNVIDGSQNVLDLPGLEPYSS